MSLKRMWVSSTCSIDSACSSCHSHWSYIRNTPWPVVAGGIPMILTILAFTFLGEALRDIFDPKLRKGV